MGKGCDMGLSLFVIWDVGDQNIWDAGYVGNVEDKGSILWDR